MASGLLSLPQERVERLLASYPRAVARRRREFYLVLAALAALAAVARPFGGGDAPDLSHPSAARRSRGAPRPLRRGRSRLPAQPHIGAHQLFWPHPAETDLHTFRR